MANIILLKPGTGLNNLQEIQFIDILQEAYDVKFDKVMNGNTKNVRKILNLMVKTDIFPVNNRICAVDGDTGEILGFVLLGRYEAAYITCFLKFALRLFTLVKINKAVKIILAFLKVFSLNLRSKKTCIADIPLIAVKEGYRRKGIGTMLLEAASRHVKEAFTNVNGKQKIALGLVVYKDNPAVKLYQRLGFEITEIYNTLHLSKIIGHRFNTHLLMRKSL